LNVGRRSRDDTGDAHVTDPAPTGEPGRNIAGFSEVEDGPAIR
jgi:hypothetical protein